MKRYFDDRDERLDAEPLDLPKQVLERAVLQELCTLFRKADGLLGPFSCPACGGCCQLARTRREPYLFPLELRAIERALERDGRAFPRARPDGACRLLDESSQRCSIYSSRPLGCRTFFCERVVPRQPPSAPIHALSARLTALSDRLDPGASPRPISELLAEAWSS